METYTPTEQEKEVIRIMNSEKANWEDGHVFVTDKVQFVMRNIIKKARKNYFSIFDEERDPVTGRRKLFVPLSEWTVETMLKHLDIDTKDIDAKGNNPSGLRSAPIFRMILKKKMEDIDFGKTLNSVLRRAAIDGTGILKLIKDEKGALKDIRVVDRMNMIFDPTVEDIKESSAHIERHVMLLPEFEELELDNTEFVEGSTSIDRTGFDIQSEESLSTEVPYVEVYERCGYLPKFCFTGLEEDRGEYIYSKAIVSGLSGSPIVHYIEEYDKEDFPYVFLKLKSVPNRADGKGVVEMLFNIQAYINEVVNSRLNVSRVSASKLWKGRGAITPQQLRRFFSTSFIKLGNQDDIQMVDTGSIDPSSYKDEEQGYLWGQRVTGTSTADEVSDNRPATNALIQQQSVSKEYNLRMEDMFLELSDFIKEKMVPCIKRGLTKGEIVRITGEPKELERIDDILTRHSIYKAIEENPVAKLTVTDEVLEEAVNIIKKDLSKMGEDRFVEVADEIFDFDYDISIVITDEQINRAVMAQMLQQTVGLLAQTGLPIRDTLREMFDLMGLDGDRLTENMPEQAQNQEQATQEQGNIPPAGISETPNPTVNIPA